MSNYVTILLVTRKFAHKLLYDIIDFVTLRSAMCEGITLLADHQGVHLVIMNVEVLGDPFLSVVFSSYAAISHDALCSICARMLISLVDDVNLFLVMMDTQKN